MKYFKTKPSKLAFRHKISYDEFIKATGRKYPFEQKNNQGKLTQYGICPYCLNPIQLIGITNKIKVSPHGKHTGKNIKDLPEWNYEKYKYCPYASNNAYRKPNDEERISENDKSVIELYNLLKNNFDKIILVLQNELNIQCSAVFWRKALQQYLINTAFCYPWLTEANLPYIFAYFGIHHQKVYKQKFRVGSDIYNTLSSYKGVTFEKNEINTDYEQICNEEGVFLNLYFRFTAHKHIISDNDDLTESMLFCIDDRNTGKTIFKKHIEFSETYFQTLLNKKLKRQEWLLNIANELM